MRGLDENKTILLQVIETLDAIWSLVYLGPGRIVASFPVPRPALAVLQVTKSWACDGTGYEARRIGRPFTLCAGGLRDRLPCTHAA